MQQANLVMFRSTGERREFRLGGKRTVIGRKNDCDIRIPLSEISRHHTEILVVEGEKIVLKDLGSANGTFVNNKRVQTVRLAAGDHVIIGPVVFTLQIDGQPEDIRPVKTKIKRQKSASVAQPETAAVPAEVLSDDDLDPISALEALASSADQTAIDPFDEEEL